MVNNAKADGRSSKELSLSDVIEVVEKAKPSALLAVAATTKRMLRRQLSKRPANGIICAFAADDQLVGSGISGPFTNPHDEFQGELSLRCSAFGFVIHHFLINAQGAVDADQIDDVERAIQLCTACAWGRGRFVCSRGWSTEKDSCRSWAKKLPTGTRSPPNTVH